MAGAKANPAPASHTMKTLYDAMKSDGGVPTLGVTVNLMQSEQEICFFTQIFTESLSK